MYEKMTKEDKEEEKEDREWGRKNGEKSESSWIFECHSEYNINAVKN